MKQFTNEATQQMLADFDKSPFSDADLAAMDVDARQIIEQNAERGVSLDIENYCTIRTSPACQSRYLWFLSALQ
ncbi:hypothetical protein GBC03_01175 (plasmid) [Citrobacter telavivensis]|uniref:Uncharacterized protein n=1 Tax=Citrobacter telavivensis TaxID=2653932 RepID=A0A6L5EIQ7_9ENTR|nr:hypothetical protein [Citrobacter telavivensis]MPQ54505.1 hypothetical protein [Citrobacter telavivensis]QFS68896.1 hypothetical protein GBC03_01175 [Citrobacter telavivensis]HEM8614943.1 hypothetical protein [Citrobacter amalonaticus]